MDESKSKNERKEKERRERMLLKERVRVSAKGKTLIEWLYLTESYTEINLYQLYPFLTSLDADYKFIKVAELLSEKRAHNYANRNYEKTLKNQR